MAFFITERASSTLEAVAATSNPYFFPFYKLRQSAAYNFFIIYNQYLIDHKYLFLSYFLPYFPNDPSGAGSILISVPLFRENWKCGFRNLPRKKADSLMDIHSPILSSETSSLLRDCLKRSGSSPVIPLPLSVIRIYRFPFSEKDRRRIK